MNSKTINNPHLRILGIDPGSIICGYGIIETDIDRQTASYMTSGRIVVSSGKPFHIRLKELYVNISDIISEYMPDEVVVEKVFFAKSIKSALTLGHARGVALLAAASAGLPLHEYSALEVKKAVVGYGRAGKPQVQSMISRILNLKSHVSEDSADALAIALCHLNTLKFKRAVHQS